MYFSPQTQQVYQSLLSSASFLTVKQIAQKVQASPNAIYRLLGKLTRAGLLDQSSSYPAKYKAKPIDEASSLFCLNQFQWFLNGFAKVAVTKQQSWRKRPRDHQLQISFIQSRDDLMQHSIVEINRSTQKIDLLRSGHDIPSEVMLAITRARGRGVVTRMLIQAYSPKTLPLIQNWKRNGIQVRQAKLRKIRLMLYDLDVVYFMSFKHLNSTKDQGMKIVYRPLAAILRNLFDRWWSEALPV